MHSKLSQILKKAFVDRKIDRNPCDAIDGITRPKVTAEKRAVKRISEAEALRFQKELRDEPKTSKTMAVWIALATGLRRGEVLVRCTLDEVPQHFPIACYRDARGREWSDFYRWEDFRSHCEARLAIADHILETT